jgi:hypothetical protein
MFVFLKDMCNMLWPWQSALCKPLHSIPSSWYDRKSRITVTRDCLFNMLVVCLCIYLLDKCVRWCFMVPATSTARKISRHEAIWRERGSPSTCFESQLAQNLEWRSALSTLAALAHWVLFTSVWSAKPLLAPSFSLFSLQTSCMVSAQPNKTWPGDLRLERLRAPGHACATLRHVFKSERKNCCSAQGNWIRVDWEFCPKWACSQDATVKGICTTMIVLQKDFRSDQRLSSMENIPPVKSVKFHLFWWLIHCDRWS